MSGQLSCPAALLLPSAMEMEMEMETLPVLSGGNPILQQPGMLTELCSVYIYIIAVAIKYLTVLRAAAKILFSIKTISMKREAMNHCSTEVCHLP